MSSPSFPPLEVVVARLRAGGCVFAEDEAALLIAEADSADGLAASLSRRIAGEPLEQVLGWAEFCGLRIAVDPGVFVPRRRTEFLVDEAVASAAVASAGTDTVVVDLCCGSGAVAAALAAALERAQLYAADLDPIAVRCARRNLNGVAEVFEGDLFAALPEAIRGRVDLLVANVPYVPTDAVALLPPEARLHEARMALDGGPDGLDVARRVAVGSRHWLADGGRLLFETSERQADAAATLLADAGLTPRIAVGDEYGTTVLIGRRHA